MRVEIANVDGFLLSWPGCRRVQKLDRVAFLQPARGVKAQFIIDLGTPVFNVPAYLAPRESRQAGTQKPGDRQTVLCGIDAKGLRGHDSYFSPALRGRRCAVFRPGR